MNTTTRRQERTRAALLAGAIAVGVGGATAARAEDVSADAARDMEQQVHDRIAALLGPTVPVAARPLHVTAEADHYLLELPFSGQFAGGAVTLEGDPFSAQLTPLDGGRWALDEIHIPSPLRVSFPAPAAAGAAAGATASVTATIDKQEQRAVIDPSLATPSHWDATFKGYSYGTEGMKQAGASTMHIDESSAHISWGPVQAGRLTIVEDTDTHLMASNSVLPDGSPASFSIGRMRGAIRLEGLSTDAVATLLHAVTVLAPLGAAAAAAGAGAAEAAASGGGTSGGGTSGGGASAGADVNAMRALAEQNHAAAEADRRAAEADTKAVAEGRMTQAERTKNADERRARARDRLKAVQAMQAARAHPAAGAGAGAGAGAAAGAPQLTAEQRTTVHEAVVALVDLLDGFDEHVSLQDLHFVGAGHTGHLDKLETGLSIAAPDGRTAIHFNLVLDGLDSPEIPPGVYRDYLPHHVAFAPRIGGVPAADLRELLLLAVDSQGKDPQLMAQAMGLLAKGPVAVGLDELAFDFGPATLKGTGEVRVAALDQYEGEAHVVITGLDTLMQQANTVPELKQAAPVLLLLKGMGKQTGADTVWDITYRDKKVLVNGADMSSLIPGNK